MALLLDMGRGRIIFSCQVECDDKIPYLAWALKAEYLLFKSKQKSCKLFIAINRPKS